MSKEHILQLLSQGIRLDGRGLLDYRDVKVEYGASVSAEGSAKVTIGDTIVITGIKMAIGTPYSDTPNQGNLMCGAELSPLASPEFETGAPGIKAIEIGRVIDRGIRESHLIDLKDLCHTPGEKVWSVSIDICPINDEGNLFDAGSLSALAALKDTKLPELSKEGVINYDVKTKTPLPIADNQPISVTVCKIGDYIIVDPIAEEEKWIDARLTVATTKDGELCALQKGGDEPLTIEEVDKMVTIAIEKTADLRKAL